MNFQVIGVPNSAVVLSEGERGKTFSVLLRHWLPWPQMSRVISNISHPPSMYIPTRTDPTTLSHLSLFQSKHSVSVAGTALKDIEKNMANISSTCRPYPQLKMIPVSYLPNMLQTFQCKRLLTSRSWKTDRMLYLVIAMSTQNPPHKSQ